MSTKAITAEFIKSAWIKNPELKFNVPNKLRKEMMLSNNETIIHHANLYNIKYKNLGGGVWEAYCERRVSK